MRVLGQGTRGEGGHLLSACVGECCECRVEGVGAAEALLFPSAGKQCPRRVFYGSCWTLISFVARLSSAAAALSPQKRAPPLPLPPPPGKPRTTRLRPYPGSTTGFTVSPAGKCVTNQLMINLCERKKAKCCELGCIKDISDE